MAEKTNPIAMGAPQPKRRHFTPYVLIWAMLAGVSLVYLVLLATQPTLVARLLGAGPEIRTAQASEHERAMMEAVAEVRSLRETVDRFRDDLMVLKSEVSDQAEKSGEITARLTALEAAAAADPQKVAAEKAAEKRSAAKAPKADPAAQPQATAAAANKAQSKLETGSVAASASKTPLTFGPAVVTPAKATAPAAPGKALGVQIASGDSVDSLRLSWTLMLERHGDSLRSLQPRYTVGSDGANKTYDLVVGPLNSAAEANRLCRELAAQATPCSISVYSGDVL